MFVFNSLVNESFVFLITLMHHDWLSLHCCSHCGGLERKVAAVFSTESFLGLVYIGFLPTSIFDFVYVK